MQDYRDFTALDRDNCLYATQRDLERMFRRHGVSAVVSLNKVLDCNSQLRLFWVCQIDGEKKFIPLFVADAGDDSPYYYVLEPVVHNEFISYNGENYICCVDERGICVLKLEKLLYQELVESVCHAQGIEVGEIYPAKLFSVQEHKFLTSCWMNESNNTCVIFPIDYRDADLLNDIDINSLNFVDMLEGEYLMAHGINYVIDKGPKGKSHLTKSLMQVIKKDDGA